MLVEDLIAVVRPYFLLKLISTSVYRVRQATKFWAKKTRYLAGQK